MVVNMAFSMVVKTIWMVVTISSASLVSILIFFPTKVDVLFQAVTQPISSKSTNPFTDIFGAGSYPNWIALTWESFDKNENWWEILRRCQILSWIVLTWESFFKWEVMRDDAKVPNRLQATMSQKGNFRKSHYLLRGTVKNYLADFFR